MLTDDALEQILGTIPRLRIGVLGDLFLDRYLDIDGRLTEPSIETGLDAYQVVRVRSLPGAAGTVVNNLAALGVGEIYPIAVIGDDGEGYELRQALGRLTAVRHAGLFARSDRRTPTYTKPMLCEAGRPPRELNRLDLKNRGPLPGEAEEALAAALGELWPGIDALLVLDQVSEPDCGVVTARLRRRLAELGRSAPGKLILADSRERIGLFEDVALKPNEAECARAVGGRADADGAAGLLARKCRRTVYCTRGERGMVVADPESGREVVVPAWPVRGPVDPVGAGDSTSAALACAVASGASLAGAAVFGNLVASVTIGQIGTTGTASPEQVRVRWQEVRSMA